MSFSKTAEFLRYKFTFYKINVYFYKNNISEDHLKVYKIYQEEVQQNNTISWKDIELKGLEI